SLVSLTLDHVTLRHNRAVGGDRNTAGTILGSAWGGGLATNGAKFLAPPLGSTTTVTHSMIADNQAVGGQGDNGDDGSEAHGGGIANFFGGLLTVSDSTLAGNQALGGAGGADGNGGPGQSGGLFNDG